MNLSPSRVQRLRVEQAALNEAMPQARLVEIEGRIAFICPLWSNSGERYLIEVALPSDYPNSPYDLIILEPKPLLGFRGRTYLSKSGADHVLNARDGCVRICHTHSARWSPDKTVVHGLTKARLFIEALERSRNSGENLDTYLPHQ